MLTSFWWPLTFAILDDIFLLTGTHAKCLGIVALFFYTCLSVRWLRRFHLLLDQYKRNLNYIITLQYEGHSLY